VDVDPPAAVDGRLDVLQDVGDVLGALRQHLFAQRAPQVIDIDAAIAADALQCRDVRVHVVATAAEVDERPDAGIQQAGNPAARDPLVPVAGMLACQQLAGLHPVTLAHRLQVVHNPLLLGGG
jgi:hypothetical protein